MNFKIKIKLGSLFVFYYCQHIYRSLCKSFFPFVMIMMIQDFFDSYLLFSSLFLVQMEYNWRSLCLALVLLTFSFVSVLSHPEQNKQDTHILCGSDFIDVWRMICELKEKKRGRGNRTKRSILGRCLVFSSCIFVFESLIRFKSHLV